MKINIQNIKKICCRLLVFGSLLISTQACDTLNLEGETTPFVAALNQPFNHRVEVSHGGFDFFDDSHSVYWTGGMLPLGVNVSRSGVISGIPTQNGIFDFELTAYDDDYHYNSYEGEDDPLSEDSEWYRLFVATPSSNNNCPNLTNYNGKNIAVCLGSVVIDSETNEAGRAVDLDVTIAIPRSIASSIKTTRVEMIIVFDPNYLEPDFELDILRGELADYGNAQISFESIDERQVKVTFTAQSKSLNVSGQLMKIPFTILEPVDKRTEFLLSAVNIIHAEDASSQGQEIQLVNGEFQFR